MDDKILVGHIIKLKQFYRYIIERHMYLIDPHVSDKYKWDVLDALQKSIPDAKRSLIVLMNSKKLEEDKP